MTAEKRSRKSSKGKAASNPPDKFVESDAMPDASNEPRSDRVAQEPAESGRAAGSDSRVNDGGRSASEGNIETEDAGDEDSRSRRRDLGP